MNETQQALFLPAEIGNKISGPNLNVAGQPGNKRVVAMGHLQLGQNLTPGDYILKVIFTDIADRKKPRVASQWIPFEIE